METVDKNIVEITIAGKNVTGDISPMLSSIIYADKEEAQSDDISITVEDTQAKWQQSWYPQQGDSLQIQLGTVGKMLNCGLFEIDEIELEFPPDTMVIKGIATAISKELRTKNSKAFEKQSLKQVAHYFADKHNLKLTGNIGSLGQIEIERKTQEKQTDLSFLASLAREYGLIFSVKGNQLVFMDAEDLDAQPSIMTIDKRQMSKGRFVDKTAQTYGGAIVATRNVKTNTVKTWEIKPAVDGKGKNTLVVDGRAENESQAKAKAQAALKEKNREKITGSISVPGNVKLVAGVNIDLTGIGAFSGKWHVVTTSHSMAPDSGYTTEVNARKILA